MLHMVVVPALHKLPELQHLYGNRIISRRHGIPLGVGAVLIRKTERIHSLVQIIGGADTMNLASKIAVDEAIEIAGVVQALAIKAAAELTEIGPDGLQF